MTDATNHSTIHFQLPGDVMMPAIALGTYPMQGAEAAHAVEGALRLGYRHVDTAENYHNEDGVGEGIRRSGLPREEVFITTKFNRQWHSIDGVRQAFENSVQRLGVDYLDLFLIHWPNPEQGTFVEAFEGLARLQTEGKVRAIGVSNFKPKHLQQLFDAGLAPAVNQIQLDPEYRNPQAQQFHREHGIRTEAYTPLGRGGAFLHNPALTEPAQKYGKTPAQVTLRWHVQQGIAAAPKSAHPQRQQQNLDIFDFELTDAEIERINSLDTGKHARQDSESFGH